VALSRDTPGRRNGESPKVKQGERDSYQQNVKETPDANTILHGHAYRTTADESIQDLSKRSQCEETRK